MAPYKVLHLTSAHPRYDTRIFLKECVSLARAGFETHLIVADGLGDERRSDVFIHDVGASRGRMDRMRNAPSRVLQKALELCGDLFHFHDPELIPVGIKLKKMGKCVIFDVHEDVPKQLRDKPYLNGPAKWALSRAFALYERMVSKKFDYVVCATPSIREKFLKLGARAVDVNNFPILGELSISTAPSRKTQAYVCYVGGMSRVRGIIEIVAAMGEARNDIRLQLVGNFGEPGLKEEIQQEVGWGQVELRGYLSRRDVAELLSGSLAGLVTFLPAPNHMEAQPNKMFEYMSAGIPVIASDFPLWREIVLGNHCGLCVDPSNPKSIAEAIDYLVDSPEESKLMGRNGQKAVETKYNWTIEEKKLLNVYKEVI